MSACLHILNKLPQHRRATYCLQQLQRGDRLLLIEDGIMALTEPDWVASLPYQVEVLAVEADVAARGLTNYLNDSMQTVDYSGFVKLTEDAQKIVSW